MITLTKNMIERSLNLSLKEKGEMFSPFLTVYHE